MPQLPEAGAQLTLDTSAWDAAYNKVVKQAAELDGIIKAVGGKITVDVSANTDMILADISKIDSQAPTVNVDIALEDTAYKSLLDLDGQTLTPTVDVQHTTSSKEVVDGMKQLAALSVINIAVNAGGSAIGLVEKFARIGGVAGLFEMDTALATIEARTGNMIPDADKLINELYVNGWGESVTAIADVITQADNLNISQSDMATAVQNALVLQTAYGEDTSETLRAMDSLVKNDLAKDFQEAADILVTGFQNGANRGQDLLDTFNEYGTTFAGLGISGTVALSLINAGLAAGIDNSDRVADAVREIGIRLNEIGTDETITQSFEELDALSKIDLSKLLEGYRAGSVTGDEYFKGFFDALNEASTADPTAAARIATNLIGTQSEDFKIGAFSALADGFDLTAKDIEGRAAAAGTAISNTLSEKWLELGRAVEVAAQNFLSSEQIDLPGKIDAIKQGLTDAVSILQSGGTLGQALEVGFNIQGVDAFLGGFQSTVGNFAINLLEMIASIQDFLGKGSGGTRTEITKLAENQLTFDLKLADNQEEITNTIQTAIARGVDMKTIAESAGVAVEELMASGSVGAAKALIDEIQFQGQGFVLSPEIDPLFGEGVTLQNSLNTWIEDRNLDAINDAISRGLVIAPEGIDVSDLQTEVDTAVTALTDQFNTALATGDINLANTIAQQLGDPALIEQVAVLAEAMGGVTLAMETQDRAFAAAALGLTTESGTLAETMITNMGSIEGAITQTDTATHNAIIGNSIVPDLILLRNTATMNLPIISLYLAALAISAETNLSIVDSWTRIATDSMIGFGNVLPILDLLIAKLGSVSAAATNVTSQVNGLPTSPPGGGQPEVTPMATGGAFASGQSLLFEGYGPEIVSFNKPGNVVGVEQTRQLMQDGTTINNYNSFNVIQNNNVQSQAQAAQAGYSIAKSIRGMGT